MLISTITRYAVAARLFASGHENVQEFGTQTIAVDTTVTLTQTGYTNNQEFGFQTIAAVPPSELTLTSFTNDQEFGTQVIAVDSGVVTDALLYNNSDHLEYNAAGDYLKYK